MGGSHRALAIDTERAPRRACLKAPTRSALREKPNLLSAGPSKLRPGFDQSCAARASQNGLPDGFADEAGMSRTRAAVSNATTFLTTFDSTEMGSLLAGYLRHALDRERAVVIYKDNGYGRPIAAGFKATAERVGLRAEYRAFDPVADAAEVARQAAADPDRPAIVLAMVDGDAAAVLKALARQGLNPTVLGTSAIAAETFVEEQFAKEPEARNQPGFFTSGVYALAPLIVDSANAEGTRFAERYRARFGHVPRWEAAQGYDATRLAIAAGRAALARGASDVAARRKAVVEYLTAIDGPAQAISSLTGPLWFTPTRNRQQAARVGRFHDTGFEFGADPARSSEPPDEGRDRFRRRGESGHFARRQQVVYAGVFVNEVSRIDLAPSTFTADLYLWLRYKPDRSAGAIDPAEIDFPDLVRGNFDPRKPAEAEDLDDGSAYRLWGCGAGAGRVQERLRPAPLSGRSADIEIERRARACGRGSPRLRAGSTGTARPGARRDGGPQQVRQRGARGVPQPDPVGSGGDDHHPRHSCDGIRPRQPTPRRRAGGTRGQRHSGYYRGESAHPQHAREDAAPARPAHLDHVRIAALPSGASQGEGGGGDHCALSGAVLLAAINAQLGSVGYVIAVEVVFYTSFLPFVCCASCRCSPPSAFAPREKTRSRSGQKPGHA